MMDCFAIPYRYLEAKFVDLAQFDRDFGAPPSSDPRARVFSANPLPLLHRSSSLPTEKIIGEIPGGAFSAKVSGTSAKDRATPIQRAASDGSSPSMLQDRGPYDSESEYKCRSGVCHCGEDSTL